MCFYFVNPHSLYRFTKKVRIVKGYSDCKLAIEYLESACLPNFKISGGRFQLRSV